MRAKCTGERAAVLQRCVRVQRMIRRRISGKDVVSGEWIFGRGAADMKGGLAAGLAVLDGIGEQVLDGTDRLNEYPVSGCAG